MSARLTTPGSGSLVTVGTNEYKVNFTSTDDNGFLNILTIEDGCVRIEEDGVYNIHTNIVFAKNGQMVPGTVNIFIKVNGAAVVDQPFSYNVTDAIGFSVTTLENLSVGDLVSVHLLNSFDSSLFKVTTTRENTYLLINKV